MSQMFNQILLQTLYYAIVMLLSIGIISLLLKGFFWKYVKVRMSFGRFILVKVRSSIRDYFCIGRIEENNLVYKRKTEKGKINVRIKIPAKNSFYRALAVLWADVDEATNAICATDYTPMEGYDAEKFDALLTRALMKPSVKSSMEKLILVALGGLVLVTVFVGYLAYLSYSNTQIVPQMLPSIKSACSSATQVVQSAASLG